MKILAFSNLHSRVDEFKELMSDIQKEHRLNSFDKIIFLGDYTYYGRKNVEMIEYLLKLKKENENIIFLLGNWEYFMGVLEYSHDTNLKEQYYQFFVQFGQAKALAELQKNTSLYQDWMEEIKKMKNYHVEGDMIFSHAGVDISRWRSWMKLDDFMKLHDRDDLLLDTTFHLPLLSYWISHITTLQDIYDPFPYTFVFGQTAINKILNVDKSVKFNEPFHLGNGYGIDFGGIYTKGRIGGVIFSNKGTRTYVRDVKQTPYKKKPTYQKTVHSQ